MSTKYDNPLLDQYATPTQAKYLKELRAGKSLRQAAAACGTSNDQARRAMRRLERKIAHIDPSVHAHSAPEGYVLRGASTLLDRDGVPVLQWVKTKIDQDKQLDLLKEAIAEITETNADRLAPLPAPLLTDEDVLAVYPLPDAHIGLLAWAQETGADFDLKIAERTLCDTFDRLVAAAPPARSALFVNLGDFFHTDSPSRRTERAGNPLDVDSRYAKIVKVGLCITQRIIDRLLQKHSSVEVWTVAGNHDENTSIVLGLALKAIYSGEPRISVPTDTLGCYRIKEYGTNLIGAAHGHTAAINKLPAFMAANWPEAWGRTESRIWYTGHVHHDSVQEYPGCIVETLRTIAQRDAWTVSAALKSGRDLKCDVWHRKDGRIARIIQRAVY